MVLGNQNFGRWLRSYLTTMLRLQKLHNVERNGKVIKKCGQGGNWKYAVPAY